MDWAKLARKCGYCGVKRIQPGVDRELVVFELRRGLDHLRATVDLTRPTKELQGWERALKRLTQKGKEA